MTFQLSGLASFLIVRMWFEKAIDDFNKSIVSQGKNAPELVAAAGNGFTSAYHGHIIQRLAPSDCNLPRSGLDCLRILWYPSHCLPGQDQRPRIRR
jgi:hypothetical protein